MGSICIVLGQSFSIFKFFICSGWYEYFNYIQGSTTDPSDLLTYRKLVVGGGSVLL